MSQRVTAVRRLHGTDLVDVYDVTVADTHLYYAAGCLVANSKRISLLDTNALLAHGATETLRDASAIRGQRGEDYWLQFMQGHVPRDPKVPVVYQKFLHTLQAAGVHVVHDGPRLHVLALTDHDVDKLAGDREVTSGATVRFDKGLQPVPGGLFDEKLGGHGGTAWGYIKLHEPMPAPVMEEPVRRLLGLTQKKFEGVLGGTEQLAGHGTGPPALAKALEDIDVAKELARAKAEFHSGKKSGRDDAAWKWSVLESAQRLKIHPRDWVLSKAPVLPPKFRPINVLGQTGVPLVADANILYKELLEANDNLKAMHQAVGPEEAGPERLALYHAFKAVTGLGDPVSVKSREKGVQGLLQAVFGSSPKWSMMQRRLIGSTVDNVGRGVIVPDPDYDMDTVGLPEDQAFPMYTRFVARRLHRRGLPLREALQHIRDRTDLARSALQEEMDERPVFIARAPVLHKFGILAFRPKLVTGSAVRMPPLAFKGFNMDADGNCLVFSSVVCIEIDPAVFYADSEASAPWRTAFMRLTQQHNVWVSKSGTQFTLPIGEFPRIGEPILAKNGGRIYPVPRGIKALTYDPAVGAVVYRPVTHVTIEDNATCARVTTRRGKVIEVSDNESLAAFDPASGGLVRIAPRHALGRLVPIVVKHGRCGDQYDFDAGWWYGALVADGWVTERTVGYAKNDDRKRAEFLRITRKLFGSEWQEHVYADKKEQHGNKFGDSVKLHINCRDVVKRVLNIHAAPVVTRGALVKCLPKELLENGSRDCLLGLLSGLLDGDAIVAYPPNTARAKPQFAAKFYTSSPYLRDDITRLLTRLGVRFGVITYAATEAHAENYAICPATPDVYRLAGELRLVGQEAAAALSTLVRAGTPKDNYDIVPVPATVARTLSRVLLRAAEMTLYTAIRKATKTGACGRDTARRAAELSDDAAVKDWQARVIDCRDVHWDFYAKVEPLPAQTVFDLAVPDTKVFVTDGGLVVWDTVQVHTPTSPEAVKEAYERLLPSKNLLAVSDFKTPMHAPEKELALGLYALTKAPDARARPRYFRGKKDALAALARGDVLPTDPIVILAEDH